MLPDAPLRRPACFAYLLACFDYHLTGKYSNPASFPQDVCLDIRYKNMVQKMIFFYLKLTFPQSRDNLAIIWYCMALPINLDIWVTGMVAFEHSNQFARRAVPAMQLSFV
jgi:hypothetical protein